MLSPSLDMSRHLFVLLISMVATMCSAQVIVDKAIELNASDGSQRQVLGLPPSTNSDAAMSAEVEQSGTPRYAESGMGATWQLDYPALVGAPTPGTQIIVHVMDTTGSGPLQVMINGTGPYAVLRMPGTPLMAEETPANRVLSLVFDGVDLQVMNGMARGKRPCPSGMVAAGQQFCIEVTDRDTLDFLDASTMCASLNRRLCTWGEWYTAAVSATTFGLSAITGNWEWTDDACNEDRTVRIVGLNSAQHTGCAGMLTPARNYRCCYTQ